jgi:dipeptidyl aminopeptidase/acylaminoacyl peptidase
MTIMLKNLLIALLLLQALLFLPGSSPAQTDSLRPYDNLVVEGIPHIPPDVIRGVGRYTEFRSAGFNSWDPVKREMLISTRFAETNQIHRVNFPGGARTQLTFFTDRVGGAAFGPKNPAYFVFSKDIGGGEWFQIYRYDVAAGEVTLLTDGKSRNSIGAFSTAGDRLAYTSTRRNNKDTDVYVVEPLNPASDRLLLQLEGGGWAPIDWSPDDRTILVAEYVSANESYLWTVDAATGAKALLTPKVEGEQVARSAAMFSRDGMGLYVVSDEASEFQRLAYVDLATKERTFLTGHIDWDVEDAALSPDGGTMAFITNENGIGVFHMMDLGSKKEVPAPALPKGIVSGLSWHQNGEDLAFNISSATSSTDVFSLNVKTGRVDRWTASETGGLNTAAFSEPELVAWKSFDGKTITGFLYRPPSKFTGKRPVMVNIHGGPEGQSRPGFLGRNNYYLNELGVAIVFPNTRGSTGYGKSFLKADNGFKREDAYRDLETLLDWIKTRPDLDGDRIMVTGGSYGGHSTFAVATRYADKIACALPVVGMSNLVTFLENTEGYRRDLRRVEYGDERDPKMREYLEGIAPLKHAKNVTKPLFVVQGKNDPRVPWSEAGQMISTVKQNGTPVWSLLANDEGHGFAKKKNQDYQFYATVMFMKQFLLKEGAR